MPNWAVSPTADDLTETVKVHGGFPIFLTNNEKGIQQNSVHLFPLRVSTYQHYFY